VVEHLSRDFQEIPQEVRDRIDREVEQQVFDLLHAEAVKRKELPAPPSTLFDKAPGRIVMLLFQIAFGAVFGTWAVIAVVYSIRSMMTVL
jgi:hypothetical protein